MYVLYLHFGIMYREAYVWYSSKNVFDQSLGNYTSGDFLSLFFFSH